MCYSNICAWKLASHYLEAFDITDTLQKKDVSVREGAVGNISCPSPCSPKMFSIWGSKLFFRALLHFQVKPTSVCATSNDQIIVDLVLKISTVATFKGFHSRSKALQKWGYTSTEEDHGVFYSLEIHGGGVRTLIKVGISYGQAVTPPAVLIAWCQ